MCEAVGSDDLPCPGTGDDALMSDDAGPLPTAPRLAEWVRTLPVLAADAVASSDITKPHVYIQVRASPQQLGVIRSHLNDWIGRIGATRELAQDMVLAVDEAASNAVEHAYPDGPGTLTLFAGCDRSGQTTHVIVSDTGTWRPPPVDPGFRGRGLAMMGLLASLFELCSTPNGTTIVLGWPVAG
jgi:serine/threonine-protein kinase RsbW